MRRLNAVKENPFVQSLQEQLDRLCAERDAIEKNISGSEKVLEEYIVKNHLYTDISELKTIYMSKNSPYIEFDTLTVVHKDGYVEYICADGHIRLQKNDNGRYYVDINDSGYCSEIFLDTGGKTSWSFGQLMENDVIVGYIDAEVKE